MWLLDMGTLEIDANFLLANSQNGKYLALRSGLGFLRSIMIR